MTSVAPPPAAEPSPASALRDEFARVVNASPDEAVLRAAAASLASLGKTPAEFVRLWEVWSLNNDLSVVTIVELQKMTAAVLAKSKAKAKVEKRRSSVGGARSVKRFAASTPPTHVKAHAPAPTAVRAATPPLSADKFAEAVGGARVPPPSYNESLALEVPSTASKLEAYGLAAVRGASPEALYMHEPIRSRADLLREEIIMFGEQLLALKGTPGYADLPERGIDQVCSVSHDDRVLCVGRIACETPTGSLNATSVCLEGENGKRVALDLAKCLAKSYDLFPGKLIGVRGLAPTSSSIVVDQFLDLPPLSPPTVTLPPRVSPTPRPNFTAAFACGPYFESNTIVWDTLDALLNTRADLLVLCGPFAPEKIFNKALPVVKTSNDIETSITVQMLLESICYKICRALATRPALKVALVPSVDDASSFWPSYPQEPYSKIPFKLMTKNFPTVDVRARLIVCANPDTLAIDASEGVSAAYGDVRVSISNADVLADLSSQSVAYVSAFDKEQQARNATPGAPARMLRLSSAVMDSRSLYPLFPAPSEDVCLSLERNANLRMTAPPHVCVLPSKLTPFAGVARNGTLIINPGRVLSGRKVYAKLTVLPPERAGKQEASTASLSDCCRVDFTQL